MDIEKQIEHLKTCARLGDSPIMYGFAVIADKRKLEDAATALSTLQAENEQLRSDLRRLQTERDTLWAANQHLLAERDADREED